MSSQIQCQAITLKGTQCSRKSIVCTSFCKQHFQSAQTQSFEKKHCCARKINGRTIEKCQEEIFENKYCNKHFKQYKFEKPNECPICFDKLNENELPLRCGHWFHAKCLKQTFCDNCPVCRTKMTNDERFYFIVRIDDGSNFTNTQNIQFIEQRERENERFLSERQRKQFLSEIRAQREIREQREREERENNCLFSIRRSLMRIFGC